MIETSEDIAALVEDFGELLEIAGRPEHVLWGSLPVDVPTDDTSVQGSDSSAIVTTAVAERVLERSTIIRNGVTYRVAFKEPDRTGVLVRLVLDKVTI